MKHLLSRVSAFPGQDQITSNSLFFSEKNSEAFAQLQTAVTSFHRPDEGFEIQTYHGEFADAVSDIQKLIGSSFPLIFIDPTGWTEYPLDKIKPLFARQKCEVLINFMYDHINRFANSVAADIIESLDPILGGAGWRERLDSQLSRGLAVEKLFRETLKLAGQFNFVISTKIDKATAERPRFFITYATKSAAGLIEFRNIEYQALRVHAKSRANAKEQKIEHKYKMTDMFSGFEAEIQEASIDEIVEEQKASAAKHLIAVLEQHGQQKFSAVVATLLQAFILRETNIKDICVELSRTGKVENTWGSGNRKPQDSDPIRLKRSTAVQ